MLAQVTSCAVVGLEGALVQVVVDVSNGGPYSSIVGLVGKSDYPAKAHRGRVHQATIGIQDQGPLERRADQQGAQGIILDVAVVAQHAGGQHDQGSILSVSLRGGG